jgi:hypothetical protein
VLVESPVESRLEGRIIWLDHVQPGDRRQPIGFTGARFKPRPAAERCRTRIR